MYIFMTIIMYIVKRIQKGEISADGHCQTRYGRLVKHLKPVHRRMPSNPSRQRTVWAHAVNVVYKMMCTI